MPPNPHDALFKRVFSDATHAAGEFKSVLPPRLVAAIDFDTLALAPGSFVDEALRERHTDLLYAVRLRERDALLYLVFEHQSVVDPLMPFRLLVYVTRVWERWLRDHEGARRLPAVVPIVLHHSETGWTAAPTLTELVDLDADLLEDARPYLPELRMLLDDLGKVPDEALHERAMTTLARLVLWSLRTARSGAFTPATLSLWARALRDLGEAPSGREALDTILRYLVEVLGDERRDVIDMILTDDVGDRVKEAYVTLHDRILEEGLQKGLQKGRQEGRREGLREVVQRLTEVKFGPLSDDVRARLEQYDSTELERIAERVLDASAIDELWR